MANVGSGASGLTLIGAGNGASPTFASIGTNSGLIAHGVILGGIGSGAFTATGTGTSGQLLQSGGASANPAYTIATYPSTTTINQLLYSSSANTVAGLATVNSAVLVTTSSGVPGFSSTMTSGQVIIGSTGSTPVASTLSAGNGISIANSAGSITISAIGAGFVWNNETISYSASAENGYRSTAVVTGTLPAAGGTDGATILFQATTTDAHTIAPSTTDVIQLGNKTSTNGTGSGKIVSTAKGDTVELVYQNSSGTWFAQNYIGNWTVV